jgi:hypothetical protein
MFAMSRRVCVLRWTETELFDSTGILLQSTKRGARSDCKDWTAFVGVSLHLGEQRRLAGGSAVRSLFRS